METQEKSFIESITQFIRKSVTLKLLTIFILMLLLMIPMSFVQSLIHEREQLRQTTINEVSDKWAKQQHVYGPILTLPFNRKVIEDGKVKLVRDEAHFLPSQLNIEGKINPGKLTRSIYEVVVYDSKIGVSGSFNGMSAYLDEIKQHQILWNEAFLTINISDLRGVKDKVEFNWNGRVLPIEPGSQIPDLIKSGITVNNIFNDSAKTDNISFSFNLHLKGSQYLGFAPLGKETMVKLSSNWPDPSFSGSFLPDNRTVSKDGFSADYKILELNRNYPQFWTGTQNVQSLSDSDFGVDLMLPMNDYQKATRSAKYAILAIALTFLTFFLVEIFNKKEVHPFQYILIGMALVLFYTLLISISEHTNFDVAYIISSVFIIGITGFYARAILKNLRQTITLVSILMLTYAFVYLILQLQDYALLIGSVGLTAILALTMFITRNVNWYDLNAIKKHD